MYIQSLYVRGFRNYVEAEVYFSPKLNLFYGQNAQGKTNLLEAISLLTGRSFRTPHLAELVHEKSTFFFLEAKVVKNGFEHTIAISFDRNSKKLILDGNTYTTLQHLLGLVPSIFLIPSDIEMISGAPMLRRRFINLHLAQQDPLYIHHLSRYIRAMKQRNALLRSEDLCTIEHWEKEMVDSASFLWKKRLQFLIDLQAPLRLQGKFLSSEQELYEIKQHFTSSESYGMQLQKNRAREKQLGVTLNGPHRDDFTFLINGKSAHMFGSEGQKRSAVLALRLAEWDLFTKLGEAPPLLCIDDLTMHLDTMRKALFSQTLEPLGQTFVTTPERTESFAKAKCFHIQAGTIQTQ